MHLFRVEFRVGARNRAAIACPRIPVRLKQVPKCAAEISRLTVHRSKLVIAAPRADTIHAVPGLELLISASVLALACPTFPDDPTLVVPDHASAVLGVDVDAFARSPTGKALLPALHADLQIAEILEVMEDCRLALDWTYALVLARDRGDGRMLAVQARGLGESATLECLATELRARNEGVDPWIRESTACFDSLALADGSRVWIANSFTLVWARGSFVEPVAARMTGRAPLGLPQELAGEFARLDRSGHFWLTAKLDDDDRRALPGSWAAEVQSLTAAIDLSDGLRAGFSLTSASTSGLASTRDRMFAGFADLADRLDDYGVEHDLRARARVGIIDGVVAATLELDNRELRAIRTRIGEHIAGRGLL
jgi:hypothetical protein